MCFGIKGHRIGEQLTLRYMLIDVINDSKSCNSFELFHTLRKLELSKVGDAV